MLLLDCIKASNAMLIWLMACALRIAMPVRPATLPTIEARASSELPLTQSVAHTNLTSDVHTARADAENGQLQVSGSFLKGQSEVCSCEQRHLTSVTVEVLYLCRLLACN